MNKKLTFLCILAMLTTSAFAVSCGSNTPKENEKDTTTVEDTTKDTDTEKDTDTDTDTGSDDGTITVLTGLRKSKTEKTYYIDDADGLDNFKDIINGENPGFRTTYFQNSTVYLAEDIEYEGDWDGIFDYSGILNNVTFDGDGHTVSGLSFVASTENLISGNAPIGFFSSVVSNFTVQNVTFDNCGMRGEMGKWAGVVAGYHNKGVLTIKNVTVQNSYMEYTSTSAKKIGGIIGFSRADTGTVSYGLTIDGCTLKDSTFKGAYSLGGLGGSIFDYVEKSEVTLKNNTVSGCTFTYLTGIDLSKIDTVTPLANREPGNGVSAYSQTEMETYFTENNNVSTGNTVQEED